jgi:hypothetical protein
MFIPPEGAMQFELTEFPGECVWVEPEVSKIDFNTECNCMEGYRLISWGECTLRPSNEPVGGGTPSYCACLGKIIE